MDREEEKEIFSKIQIHDFFEENFTTVKADEFQPTGKLIAEIGYKNVVASYVLIIAGIALIAITRNIPGIVFGAVLIAFGAFAHLKIEDYKTMDIYDDSVVIYTDPGCKKVVQFRNEDITQWSVENQQNAAEAIMLMMKDGLPVYKNTFQSEKAAKFLMQTMETKEKRIINQEKVRRENMELLEKGRNAVKKFLGK
ncbi:MAG: hypothetical protein IJM15_08790 [Erysipelotrichaceae bacterium]|nr:hypothetical protein [Erysipelotrichaceae bacterium]